MDEAGLASAHIVGNSLGGYVALQLAARGRAESVVALAPAGGWARGDRLPQPRRSTSRAAMQLRGLKAAAPYAEAIVASAGGRRRATQWITTNYEHIPAGLLAHQIRGAARVRCPTPVHQVRRTRGLAASTRRGSPARSASCGAPLTSPCQWPSAAARFPQRLAPDTLTGSSSTASATAPAARCPGRGRRSSSWGSQQTHLGWRAAGARRPPSPCCCAGGDRAGRGERLLLASRSTSSGSRAGGGDGEVLAQVFDAGGADDGRVEARVREREAQHERRPAHPVEQIVEPGRNPSSRALSRWASCSSRLLPAGGVPRATPPRMIPAPAEDRAA